MTSGMKSKSPPSSTLTPLSNLPEPCGPNPYVSAPVLSLRSLAAGEWSECVWVTNIWVIFSDPVIFRIASTCVRI